MIGGLYNQRSDNWSSTVYVYMNTNAVEKLFGFLVRPYLVLSLVIEVAGSCVALLCIYKNAWC